VVATRLHGSARRADVDGWGQEDDGDRIARVVFWNLGEKSSSDTVAVLGSGLFRGGI